MSDRRAKRPGAKCRRVCVECGVRRQIGWQYRLRPDYQDGVYICKFCKPPGQKVKRPQNFDASEYSRDWNLQRRYGITAKQYDAKLAEQGGVCAICKKPPKKRNLYVDHDHTCDQGHPPEKGCPKCFRGLLCAHCNSCLEWLLTFHEIAFRYAGRELKGAD